MEEDSITSQSSIFSETSSDEDCESNEFAKLSKDFKSKENAKLPKKLTRKQADPSPDSKPDVSDEVSAMKQVFLRLSAKRAKQKDEQVADCKRRILEANKTEINQIFKKADRNRDKILNACSQKIHDLQSSVKSSSEDMRLKHAKYVEAYDVGCERLRKQLTTFKEMFILVDANYQDMIAKVEDEYAKLELKIDKSLANLEKNLSRTSSDRSYLSQFQSQIQRIQELADIE